MATSLMNLSFDGLPVQFRADSPVLVIFDPLALDMIRELLPRDGSLDVDRLLERANAHHPAISCYTIDEFRPGSYTLDPRDIQKFGDEQQDFDYGQDGEAGESAVDEFPLFPFVAVDSGALIVADFVHLPKLVGLLTWEEYDHGLQDEAVFGRIVEALGGPYFAIISGGCMPGMEFDGDGTYTIPLGHVRLSRA